MKKWLDKYEDGGAEYLGTTNKGFDYNGAWGGPSMQMGGSLPGASGMMYARVGAPSKGPRRNQTDVTDASAQNGKEMKYYQEGLDWTPRNISRDGSEIPQAQLGSHMLPIDASKAAENFFEILSAPQKALTALVSGKYQSPSEALGIKNKVGAFLTDAVLDPVNLMGSGAVAKASTETGALSKAYKYNPWAFKPNSENYYRQVGKDAIDDALSTKLIREKGEVVSPESFEKFNRQITDLHGQGDYVDYYEKMKAQTLAKEHGPMPYFMKGELFFNDKSVMKGGAKSKGVFQGKKTKADHLIESNHPSEAFQNSFAYKFSPGNVEETGGIGVLKPNPSLRDIENFKLYKQHWLKGYKEVPKPKKKEEGGEIKKDDNGYWNPDNWGKPVEIGSNEITMDGVYEPLLGISDTGDTQMMYPGEDYTFDGNTVTEYPIAQQGKTLPPIYTNNPKDPRLQAYQDSLSLSSRPQINPNPMISIQEWEKSRSSSANNYKEKGIMPIGMRDLSEKPYRASQPVFAKPKQKVIYQQPTPDTLYVDDLKNPRLKAYQDSLNLYGFNPPIKDLSKAIKEGVYNKSNPNESTGDIKPIEYYKPNIKNISRLDSEGKSYTWFQPDITKANSSKYYYDEYGVTRNKITKGKVIASVNVYKKPVQPVVYRKPEPKKEEPKKEVKKQEPVTPTKKIEQSIVEKKPAVENVSKPPYRVDYSGGSRYFPSSSEGEQFMKQLNKDFMENKISSPGNVSGYYETKKKKSGGWLSKYE